MINEHLDFDVASAGEIPFEVDTVIMKSLTHLILRDGKDTIELFWLVNKADATSSTTRDGLKHQGEANALSRLLSLGQGAQDGSAGQHGKTHLAHHLTRGDLITHYGHDAGRWT